MTTQKSAWLPSASWLTPRRIRGHALILALCLWGACIVDYAKPGLFDRAGNLKFQDFIQFSVAARLIAQGRTSDLYDDAVLTREIRAIVQRDTAISLQFFYGPQVALPFLPFIHLSFLTQAELFVTLSLLFYFVAIYLVWKTCPALRPYGDIVSISAVAYPPLFHFFVRGQLSAIVLLCFTAGYFAFRVRHDWLAGIALGFLAFKPQFLVVIPFVLLLAHSWKAFLGLTISAAAQLAFTLLYFGPSVLRSYFHMLLHGASQPGSTELSLSPIQMHSLRSFWELLIPSPRLIWILYLVSSFAVIAIAAAIWKRSALNLRFAGLLLASVLVNPHLYIYDLLALAPALLLLADWAAQQPHHRLTPSLRVLLYLAVMLPLIGPLARWTHFQFSVVVFAALLWIVWRISRETCSTILAHPESLVV